MSENNVMNPMYCDPDTGVCEVPGMALSESDVQIKPGRKPVKLVYFTDPICSSCWGIEPQLRKLKLEYGDYFDIEYRMGGLLNGWDTYGGKDVSGPQSVASHWDEASEHYQMPIDGDVWIEDPLESSHPPSVAFKAALLQGEANAQSFLRRIKEMVFLEKKNIIRWENLLLAAEQTNLNVDQFTQDYQNKAPKMLEEDLELKQQLGVRGFPTIFFTDEEGNRLLVYGSKPYEKYEETLRILYSELEKSDYDKDPKALFSLYRSYTTREFAELSGIGMEEAEIRLDGLFQSQMVVKQESKNGPLWIRRDDENR